MTKPEYWQALQWIYAYLSFFVQSEASVEEASSMTRKGFPKQTSRAAELGSSQDIRLNFHHEEHGAIFETYSL